MDLSTTMRPPGWYIVHNAIYTSIVIMLLTTKLTIRITNDGKVINNTEVTRNIKKNVI